MSVENPIDPKAILTGASKGEEVLRLHLTASISADIDVNTIGSTIRGNVKQSLFGTDRLHCVVWDEKEMTELGRTEARKLGEIGSCTFTSTVTIPPFAKKNDDDDDDDNDNPSVIIVVLHDSGNDKKLGQFCFNPVGFNLATSQTWYDVPLLDKDQTGNKLKAGVSINVIKSSIPKDAMLKLQFGAVDLPKMDTFGGADPYFRLMRGDFGEAENPSAESGGLMNIPVIYQSPVISNERNPTWPEFSLPWADVCDYALTSQLYIRVFDRDVIGDDDWIGGCNVMLKNIAYSNNTANAKNGIIAKIELYENMKTKQRESVFSATAYLVVLKADIVMGV